MPVKLRLHRLGKKKQPHYRIVAIDSRKSRDGAYLEKIGHYNPKPNPAELTIDREKALKWLQYGAIPTDSVRSLLQQEGIILEWDLRKRGLAEEQIAAELAKFREGRLQRQKRIEAMAAMAKRKSEKAGEKPSAAAEGAATSEPKSEDAQKAESASAPEGAE